VREPIVLFDANGNFGKPATGKADFPTMSARLAHMGRLGISRSLVWNSEARVNHSLSCNRRLLDEIAHKHAAKDRIIPALAISGLIVYEHDGIATLKAQMQEGRTRALRFASVFDRLTLRQCQPIISALRDLRPFIVMHHRDARPDDVREFAAMFPEIPLVITDAMWPQGIGVLDMMRQSPSVMLETSWWHTWEGIRLVVGEFGAERVIFGTGLRAHNGAAIAALARADITAGQRELIAHGNLDRLTGLASRDLASASPLSQRTLWRRCLAGEPLGVDFVDAHAHIGPSGGYVLEYQEERLQIPEAIRVMDALGQKLMILSGLQAALGAPIEGNDLIQQLLKPHADRFGVYLAYNPHYRDEQAPLFDRYFADPLFVGFKVLAAYQGAKVNDPRFEPMWEFANRHCLPILVHTWDGPSDSPALLRDVAKHYPDLTFILGHSGGGEAGRRDAVALVNECPNTYLEWCGSFVNPVPWEETLRQVDPSRVVYGSDAVVHDIHWELGRLLSLDVPEETIIPILGANMRRILARRR
jgi:uncharacterized protein